MTKYETMETDTISQRPAAARAYRLQAVTDRLLDRVEEVLMDPEQKGSSELKNLAGILKNIKDIQMIRSPLDEREQQMKIAAMEKQAGTEAEGLTVTLQGPVETWAG